MSAQLSISSQLACQYFELELPSTENLSYQLILEALTTQVQHLLNSDFQALLNALYRIDVDEVKFRKALELSKPDEVSQQVAKLILERIIAKAQTRLKYSNC